MSTGKNLHDTSVPYIEAKLGPSFNVTSFWQSIGRLPRKKDFTISGRIGRDNIAVLWHKNTGEFIGCESRCALSGVKFIRHTKTYAWKDIIDLPTYSNIAHKI